MKQFNKKRLATFGSALALVMAGGAASAATVGNFSVDVSGNVTGLTTGTVTGSGTASLDDSGVLTINSTTTSVTGFTNTTNDSVSTINGSWDGVNTLSGTSGSSYVTSCTNNGGSINGCGQITLNSPASFSSVSDPIVFDLTPGGVTTFNTAQPQGGGAVTVNQTYTLTTSSVSAVPVPAAAWLFGSGLIGLAGIARRRRAT